MDSKEFGRQLTYEREMDPGKQRAFDLHARDLVRRFSGLGSAVTNGARVDFRNYIHYVRAVHGLSAAMDRLEELLGSGLGADLYATSGMLAARRAGDYRRAADFLAKAHARWPQNTQISVFLVETMIAADRVDGAVEHLGTVDEVSEQIASSPVGLKLAELAAVCGFWPYVDRVLTHRGLYRSAIGDRTLAKRAEIAHHYRGQDSEVPVYVLNMPEDERKLSLLNHLYGKFDVRPSRHEGVDGRILSPAELTEVTAHRGRQIGKGALGCALGHFSMWERFIDGSDSHALILEDDGLPYTWHNLSALAESAGSFDVLFVNERMSAVPAGLLSTGISSLWETLGTKPDTARGWGTDGYMISRRGAEKLIEAVTADKVLSHIDSQLAAYGIAPGLVPQSIAQTVGLAVRRTSSYAPTLDIRCLDFPLVASMDFGDSTIGRLGGHAL
ncbi:glycosyltransferase family 25 protein [Arthrobacter sp. SX1312]|uniref:glycosyltransferase family 25 protein n=1 Tax=Arthrobacter sp. SX1312 TaxID=2058896 RepID=UPI0015E23D2F|nr:glycosyltransferase family 25 protein [Arthrobacter sp. SX1312]